MQQPRAVRETEVGWLICAYFSAIQFKMRLPCELLLEKGFWFWIFVKAVLLKNEREIFGYFFAG